MASPRSRGWTPGRAGSADREAGFPALAGMDPPAAVVGGPRCGLPRARGDGPGRRRREALPRRASPRSRGWTRRARRAGGSLEGFPALAGMDLRAGSGSRDSARLPRARGDGPQRYGIIVRDARASPRSRGWTSSIRAVACQHRGFPALAGMDPSGPSRSGRAAGLPRARGDGPGTILRHDDPAWASPRSRGWTHRLVPDIRLRRGFPALAGMDPPSRRRPGG